MLAAAKTMLRLPSYAPLFTKYSSAPMGTWETAMRLPVIITYFDMFNTCATQTVSINVPYSVQETPGSAFFEQLL
jgi:hypothetical protein